MKLRLVIVLTAILAGPAMADYEGRLVGNWITSAKEDRFGDGGTFIAMTGDGAGTAFAVRCLQKQLSLGILDISSDPNPLTVGDSFSFKLKVDKEAVVDATGKAINTRLIQLAGPEKSFIRQLRKGKELAIRIETARGTFSTSIFKTTGATKAFADLTKECPLE